MFVRNGNEIDVEEVMIRYINIDSLIFIYLLILSLLSSLFSLLFCDGQWPKCPQVWPLVERRRQDAIFSPFSLFNQIFDRRGFDLLIEMSDSFPLFLNLIVFRFIAHGLIWSLLLVSHPHRRSVRRTIRGRDWAFPDTIITVQSFCSFSSPLWLTGNCSCWYCSN